MRPIPSPLEHLTAFAIVFAAGVLTAASFAAYMEQVRRSAVREHCKKANAEPNSSASSSASGKEHQ